MNTAEYVELKLKSVMSPYINLQLLTMLKCLMNTLYLGSLSGTNWISRDICLPSVH